MKEKILVVDDDQFLVDMYSIKFTEEGFEVAVAFSGEEALAKLAEGFQPAIILIDIIMPEMDGFQLIETMRQRRLAAGAALIILTNLGQKDDIEKGLGLGVDGYIVKASATPSEVMTRVKEIVRHRSSNQPTFGAESEENRS